MACDWNNQTIVITGAYGGLGEELCQQLNNLGAKLIITGRNKVKLSSLQYKINENVELLAGDITDTQFRDNLQNMLASHTSDEHVLINNAGYNDVKFLSEHQDSEIQQILAVNLLAPILLTKKLLPWLMQSKKGKIINIGSTFGAIGYPGFSSYCASKFGLRGFSQALARELSDTNIDVQYLAPRAIATAINSDKVNELNKKINNAVDTPEEIVTQIIKAIEQNKNEKFFGFPEKLFVKLNAMLPSVVAHSINKNFTSIKNILTKR